MKGMSLLWIAGLSLACGVLAPVALHAATLNLTASADASLMEVADTNNNGGQEFFQCGTTQNGPRMRSVLRFDVTALPTNTMILSAAVVLSVTKLPAEPGAAAPFSLHRLLRSWSEGTNVGILNIGQGAPAALGDVTWSHANYDTNAWGAPGGLPGADFAAFESGSAFIYDVGGSPYTLGPTTELADDVTGWVRVPAANFGWFFICDDEGTRFTAKRFGSRENINPDLRPQLQLTYLIPPRIEHVARAGNSLELGFSAAAAHTYEVEWRAALDSGTWQTLTNLGYFTNATPVLFQDPLSGPARFYRLLAY